MHQLSPDMSWFPFLTSCTGVRPDHGERGTTGGGGGGEREIWQMRNSERRNVAQQNCTTFCRGI